MTYLWYISLLFITEKAMKTRLACIFLFIQLFEAYAELVFERLKEGQSLGLSFIPQQDQNRLASLHLYHRGGQSQTTLLSMAEGGEVKVDSERRARLQHRGGLNSLEINVSISRLQLSDTGLYVWEMSYREENSSSQIILGAQKVFLLVEEAGGSCHGYIPLLLTISTAAGLLLLALGWTAIEKCVRARHHHTPHPHSPIYEEMNRKQQQQAPESPQNNHEASSHLEEVNFPVYANPNIRQPQDNYYACPRQLALRA
ncbi:uncharacterized protein PAE49_023384 [Odontesthes bonariensis]|uniref:uncharacterized protein LOC142371300 n=1 Tax=Odontesthes bonariensis TaxID=219752 RepID=UPI003F58B669